MLLGFRPGVRVVVLLAAIGLSAAAPASGQG